MLNDLLSIPEVAEMAGLHRSVVHRAIQRGQLTGRRYGHYWLVERAEAERYRVAARKPGPKPLSPLLVD